MAGLASDALVHAFGSAVRRHRRAFAATAWGSDPDILGGYSCALAGQAHLRPLLAEPLDGRLFFAGEACSLHAYGTAHGAAETGIAAAEAVARQPRPPAESGLPDPPPELPARHGDLPAAGGRSFQKRAALPVIAATRLKNARLRGALMRQSTGTL